jgi:nitroreductase
MAFAKPRFVPLTTWREQPPDEMRRRAAEFADEMKRRRTVRMFSDRPVPREIIESCLAAAGSAPSGANMQPWHFVVVSDPATKKRIREAAENEEREFYAKRAPREWLEALAPLGTDEHKPFLEVAPWLIVCFVRLWEERPDGRHVKQYYAQESAGISVGLLVAGLHHAGLASLTHTPSPMGFLNAICGRPENERPFILLVTGYPAENAQVPDIRRKPLEDISTFL